MFVYHFERLKLENDNFIKLNSDMVIHPIDVVEDVKQKDFHELYVKPRKPVKLMNYTKNWPAVQKWTYDYLRKKAGHQKVKLYGRWQDNEPTKIEMPSVKEITFSEYLDMLENNQKSDLRIFLFNLFKLVPELKEDFSYTPIMENYLKDHPYLFFGCAGSDVRLHYDIDLSNVFITQFKGIKRITMFSQSQSQYLYKLPFTTHSIADLLDIDHDKYPALKYAHGYQTELKHGETLFIPSGIWHYIRYIDGSFSLSLRTWSPSSLGKLQGAYNVFVIRKLDDFINKYYKNLWRDYKLKKAMVKANEIVEKRKRM